MRASERNFTKALHRFTVHLAQAGLDGCFDENDNSKKAKESRDLVVQELTKLFESVHDFLPGKLASVHVAGGGRQYSLQGGKLVRTREIYSLSERTDSLAASQWLLLQDLPEIINVLWLVTVGHVEVEVGGSIPASAGER